MPTLRQTAARHHRQQQQQQLQHQPPPPNLNHLTGRSSTSSTSSSQMTTRSGIQLPVGLNSTTTSNGSAAVGNGGSHHPHPHYHPDAAPPTRHFLHHVCHIPNSSSLSAANRQSGAPFTANRPMTRSYAQKQQQHQQALLIQEQAHRAAAAVASATQNGTGDAVNGAAVQLPTSHVAVAVPRGGGPLRARRGGVSTAAAASAAANGANGVTNGGYSGGVSRAAVMNPILAAGGPASAAIHRHHHTRAAAAAAQQQQAGAINHHPLAGGASNSPQVAIAGGGSGLHYVSSPSNGSYSSLSSSPSNLPNGNSSGIGSSSSHQCNSAVANNIGSLSCPLKACCPDHWLWDMQSKSPQARMLDPERRSVMFHPVWSNGTAGVRGTRPLNGGIYYWEIETGNRLFGTAMMFGIGSEQTVLHADVFMHDMIGRDEHSYGLSHKGLLWNKGESRRFTEAFREYTPTTIGLMFDGIAGTLSYWRDGTYLGVAFSGLNKVPVPLFPMISSTAAKTVMSVKSQYRAFYSLQDRCRFVILARLSADGNGDAQITPEAKVKIHQLPVPLRLRDYIDNGF